MKNSGRVVDLSLDVDSLLRGTRSEDRVEKVLQFILYLGLIRDYLRAKPNDDFDNAGIDFVIYLGDEIIPLQVKSSYKGVEEHFRQHGRSVPCVVVLDNRDDGELMSQLFQTTGLDKLLVA